jgi:C4-dicarboxylate-specific signal transduction histidine kinase
MDAPATKQLQDRTRAMEQTMAQLQKTPATSGGTPYLDQTRTRDMLHTMDQTRDMLQDMTRLMDKDMDQTRSRDMTHLMDQMSQQLHDMAQLMQKDKSDASLEKRVQDRTRDMTQTMQKLQQDK